MKRRQAEKIAKNPRQRRLTIARAKAQGAFGLLDPLGGPLPMDSMIESIFWEHFRRLPVPRSSSFVNLVPA